jgi:hypothetical protein
MATKVLYTCDWCQKEFTHNSHFIKIHIPSMVSQVYMMQATYNGDEVCSTECAVSLLQKVGAVDRQGKV